MAVAASSPGVFPSNVAVLAIEESRKDFSALAARLESMRRACGASGSDEGAARAAGAVSSVCPDGNHGDNKAHATDKAFS